jgi:streptomycin 6-kinase
MIDVPEQFAREIVEREGVRGSRWIAALPGLVAELLERWGCVPTGPAMHGKVGLVVPVERSDGSAAVLKVSFPHPGNVHEPTAYAAWAGRGAVFLFDRDDAQFAMLLERVESETLVEYENADEAAAVCGRLTRRLAVPAPPDVPRLCERAPAQEFELREAADRQTDRATRRAFDAAISTIKELGPEQPNTLVHGDLHYKNVVRATREPWLVIDPKGRAGDPANDAISVVIGGFQRRSSVDDLGATIQRWLAIFADAALLDPDRVTRWTQAHALLHACWARKSARSAPSIQLAEYVATILA